MPVYWHRGRIFMWFPFLADTNIKKYSLKLQQRGGLFLKKMLCPPTPYKTELTQSILLVYENVTV